MAGCTARANARRHAYESLGVLLEDLVPERRPDLQPYEVSDADFVDAATPAGIATLGLAASYPERVPHPRVRESRRPLPTKKNS